MRIGHAAWLAVALAVVRPAAGQEAGDVDDGLAYARDRCAMCHAVEPDEYLSPDTEAPAFDEMADWPEMTGNYLRAWLITSHPTMPNLVVAPDDAADLAAYLLSLKN